MAYTISHPPAPNLGPAAIWVANGPHGEGKWYSPGQLAELLGITPADNAEPNKQGT